jgi:hypothetical protein
MINYVGWTFMSTGPNPKQRKNGGQILFIRFRQTQQWCGGHECPTYECAS